MSSTSQKCSLKTFILMRSTASIMDISRSIWSNVTGKRAPCRQSSLLIRRSPQSVAWWASSTLSSQSALAAISNSRLTTVWLGACTRKTRMGSNQCTTRSQTTSRSLKRSSWTANRLSSPTQSTSVPRIWGPYAVVAAGSSQNRGIKPACSVYWCTSRLVRGCHARLTFWTSSKQVAL